MKKQLNNVGLLIIGDELLGGRRADKHFAHACSYFSSQGIELSWVYYIGDDKRVLVEHLKIIKNRGDVCFCFGGIGATPDDRTRQAMAQAHNLKITRHPEAVRRIENRFGADAYPNRILMAELPENAGLIPNHYNDIPGFFIESIYCLPGFPEMAWPMLEWVVANRYELPTSSGPAFESLLVFGAHESELIPLLETAQEQYPGLKLSSLPRFPREGTRQLELGARGDKQHVQQVIIMLKETRLVKGYQIQENS